VDSSAISAAQHDFDVLNRAFFADEANEFLALFRRVVKVGEIVTQQFLFRLEAQHLNEGRVHIQEAAIRSGKDDALAKRFEQFREARLRLMLSSDVARPTTN